MSDLRATFDRFDKDKSGFIEVAELEALLRVLGAVSREDEAMVEALSHLESARPGRIAFDEFRDWWDAYGLPAVETPRPGEDDDEGVSEDRIKAVFERFDRDANGAIDARELAKAAMALGLDVDDDDVEKALARLDLDKNGSLSLAEFTAFVQAH